MTTMSTNERLVADIYRHVINEVTANIQDIFVEEGYDNEIITELKKLWMDKIEESGAVPAWNYVPGTSSTNRGARRSQGASSINQNEGMGSSQAPTQTSRGRSSRQTSQQSTQQQQPMTMLPIQQQQPSGASQSNASYDVGSTQPTGLPTIGSLPSVPPSLPMILPQPAGLPSSLPLPSLPNPLSLPRPASSQSIPSFNPLMQSSTPTSNSTPSNNPLYRTPSLPTVGTSQGLPSVGGGGSTTSTPLSSTTPLSGGYGNLPRVGSGLSLPSPFTPQSTTKDGSDFNADFLYNSPASNLGRPEHFMSPVPFGTNPIFSRLPQPSMGNVTSTPLSSLPTPGGTSSQLPSMGMVGTPTLPSIASMGGMSPFGLPSFSPSPAFTPGSAYTPGSAFTPGSAYTPGSTFTPGSYSFNNDDNTYDGSTKRVRLDPSSSENRPPNFNQYDGANDDEDDEDESGDEEEEVVNEEGSEEELGSGDDVEEEKVPETQNIILAQYEKVTRTKSRWKCTLKCGVMHLDGKDYLFNKLTGDFEWK